MSDVRKPWTEEYLSPKTVGRDPQSEKPRLIGLDKLSDEEKDQLIFGMKAYDTHKDERMRNLVNREVRNQAIKKIIEINPNNKLLIKQMRDKYQEHNAKMAEVPTFTETFAKPLYKNFFEPILATYDKFAAAPLRGAAGEWQRRDGLVESAKGIGYGFYKGFMEPQSDKWSPPFKQTLIKMGVSGEEDKEIPFLSDYIGKVSTAGIMGLGLDVVADLPAIIWMGGSKLGSAILGKTAKYGIYKPTKAAAEGFSQATIGVKGGSEAVDALADVISNTAEAAVKPLQIGKISRNYSQNKKLLAKYGADVNKLDEWIKFDKKSNVTKDKLFRMGKPGQAAQDLRDELVAAHDDMTKTIDNFVAEVGGEKIPRFKDKKGIGDVLEDYGIDLPGKNNLNDLKTDGIVDPKDIEKLERIANEANSTLAGVSIREGLRKFNKEFFKKMDTTYSKYAKKGRGVDLSQTAQKSQQQFLEYLARIDDEVADWIGKTKDTPDAQSLNIVDNFLENIKMNMDSLENIDTTRKILGEYGWSKKGSSLHPYARELIQNQYYGLRSYFNSAIAESGLASADEVAELVQNNTVISAWLDYRRHLPKGIFAGDDSVKPAKIYRDALESSNVDASEAANLSLFLPKKDWANVKGAYLRNNIIKYNNGGNNISYAGTSSAMTKNAKKLKGILTPNEHAELTLLLDFGHTHLPTELKLGPSVEGIQWIEQLDMPAWEKYKIDIVTAFSSKTLADMQKASASGKNQYGLVNPFNPFGKRSMTWEGYAGQAAVRAERAEKQNRRNQRIDKNREFMQNLNNPAERALKARGK